MSKSTKPLIRIHNTETDEIIDREMTDAEFANHQDLKNIENAKQIEVEAKEAARQAIFDRLGLSSDEAKLLLG